MPRDIEWMRQCSTSTQVAPHEVDTDGVEGLPGTLAVSAEGIVDESMPDTADSDDPDHRRDEVPD